MEARNFNNTNSACKYDLLKTKLLNTQVKHLKTYFSEKNSYPNCLIRHVFAQVKFINDSSLSPYTIETIQVPANANETMTYVTSSLSIRQRQ